MPYIPHTTEDIQSMLAEINCQCVDDLFKEIPKQFLVDTIDNIPPSISEMELARLMTNRAKKDRYKLSFIGAGSYEHYIPAVVWDIASRGEYLTSYTPYQAEASQGTLQLLYEYQTMIANLMNMDAANASMYDGATGLAEAILMACRIKRKNKIKQILIPTTINPLYRRVLKTIIESQKITIIDIPFCTKAGKILPAKLTEYANLDATALVWMYAK